MERTRSKNVWVCCHRMQRTRSKKCLIKFVAIECREQGIIMLCVCVCIRMEINNDLYNTNPCLVILLFFDLMSKNDGLWCIDHRHITDKDLTNYWMSLPKCGMIRNSKGNEWETDRKKLYNRIIR